MNKREAQAFSAMVLESGALPADHPAFYCDRCGYYHNDKFDCEDDGDNEKRRAEAEAWLAAHYADNDGEEE